MSRRNSSAKTKGGPKGGGARPEASAVPENGAAAVGRSAFPWLLLGMGLAAYVNSFAGAFLLDDVGRIVQNPQIRRMGTALESMAHSSRPVVQLSLAVNYALGGLDVFGYHLFNLTLHLLAGLVLFAIVRRMFESERLRARYGRVAPWLAFAAAALWLVHPLQTESVTYVIQRAESMMGLFYLLTLYCGIRGIASAHPRRWFVAAVGACALGMGSKEVMVSAPLVMLLYDRIFFANSFGEILRRRWGLYVGLAATWGILGTLVAGSTAEEQIVLVPGLTPWRYAMTQCGVLVHYLRLSIWPHPLVIDYAWRLPESFTSVLPWAVVVLALLCGTALSLRRLPWVGFWGAWFFLVLAPTSSFLPIADLAFEHRMYLPLAAVAVLVVVGVHEALGLVLTRLAGPSDLRRGLEVVLLVAAVVALTSATVRRNEDYRSELAIWSDTVVQRPQNPRAQYNLGLALCQRQKVDDGIGHFSEAVRLKPDYVEAHANLGAALLGKGQIEAAIAHFSEACRLKPDDALVRYNFGVALVQQGRIQDAIVQYSAAIRLKPDAAEAHNNLGDALTVQGRIQEAIAQFEVAVRLKPAYAEAHSNLGRALLKVRQAKAALPHFEQALRLRPDSKEALDDLRSAQAAVQQAKD